MASEPGRPGGDPRIPWAEFQAGARRYRRVDLNALAGAAGVELEHLPFALRVLLENVARNAGPGWSTFEDVRLLLAWSPAAAGRGAVGPALALRVSRVILPDSSGLPALMDLAALRAALARTGCDPAAVQPLVPVDLVVDHSLMVDHHGRADAIVLNMAREFERNGERYRFFKWAQQAFDGLHIVPPGMGIIHQVHLEHIARVVVAEPAGPVDPQRPSASGAADLPAAYPEFVLGGDSHTPMINGLGVLGWGVGGVDAEAAMLDQPYVLPWPRFVGVRLSGRLPAGATTTDLVLTVTQRLRGAGVVGAIVEFNGPGCALLSVPDRATIANMAPEYGATAGFFPIDDRTIAYLRQTGRDPAQVALVEAYARSAGLFRGEPGAEPRFDACVEIDLSEVEPSMAGPLRPQDRQPLAAVRESFAQALLRPSAEGGYGLSEPAAAEQHLLEIGDRRWPVRHGLVAIAAITACTNTSNPGVMLAAGLLARNAVRAGLGVPAHVKTSLAPGSSVVTRYLEQAGLLEPLQALGFYVIGYGCTTCSGKSGPLPEPVAQLI
ncbi:MAG: aconitate hydratase, partial [Burkholderiales bacterium]